MWTGRPILHEIGLTVRTLACRSPSWRRSRASIISIPLGTISAIKQDTWIDYVVRSIQHRRDRHALVLAGHSDYSRSFDHDAESLRGPLDAADSLYPDMGGSGGQHIAVDMAGRRDGISILGRRHAHDALGPAGGACARITCAPPAPRVCWRKLIINRHALKNSLLPVVTDHRPGVRLPDGRAGGDRTGVQPKRPGETFSRIGDVTTTTP